MSRDTEQITSIYVGRIRKNVIHFFLTIEGQALDPRPAAALAEMTPMRRSQGSAPGTRNRRERVAHIRYSEQEFSAIGAAASAVGMSISAFVRSLSLEGAGVQPFLSPADRAILELLCQDMRIVGNNLNQVARTLNSGAVPRTADLTGAVNDAQAIATTVASELAAMTKASAASRRGVPS